MAAVASLGVAASMSFANGDLEGNDMATVIEGNAGQLAVKRTGQGEGIAVVLVHGDGGLASQWDDVTEHFKPARTVVALDGRGFGASAPASDGDYSYTGRADDVASVIEAMELEQAVIVAHSGGAGTALQYAMDHPEIVRGVFLVDPATDPRAMPEEMLAGFLSALAGPDGLAVVQGYFAQIGGDDSDVVARVQADAAAVDAKARLGVAEALAHWNPEPVLAGYPGPVAALITPANDTPAALYHLRDDMEVTVVKTSGHWPLLDTPDVVAEAIGQFMLGLDD